MAYIVTAIWTSKEGQEERMLDIIKRMDASLAAIVRLPVLPGPASSPSTSSM